MSKKYTIGATKYVRGTQYLEIDIDPKDYLEAENEDELKDFIWDDLCDSKPVSNDLDNMDWIDRDTVPKEFIEEWKKLKSEQ